MKTLTIGKVAQQAGVNLQTIRYYQRRGLIEQPQKPLGGYRRYDAAIVNRVRFIKRAQLLGFNLREIAELLSLEDGRCDDVEALAAFKRNRIQQQIDDLECMKRVLDKYLAACRRNRDPNYCSLIEALYAGLDCSSDTSETDR